MMQLAGLLLNINLMIKANKTGDEIREKIRKGLDLSFKKLVQQKTITGGMLAFSSDGKIRKVKAADLSK